METKPLIAIINDWGSVESGVKGTGAITVDVDDKVALNRAAKYADAFVLTGGGDVDPERYGAMRHPNTYGVDAQRDSLEFRAVRLARKRGIPILGICRGMQLLNVAHGGTLIQNLEDSPATHAHQSTDHAIKVRRKTRLGRATSNLAFKVSSLHHQAVSQVGEGLVPAAWAHDGTVEAIESAPGRDHFVLGVQFHPEMDYTSEAHAIFELLHDQAMSKARGRSTDARARAEKIDPDVFKPAPTIYGGWSRGTGWSHGFAANAKPETIATVRPIDSYGHLWDDDYMEWDALERLNRKPKHQCGSCPVPGDCVDECLLEALAYDHAMQYKDDDGTIPFGKRGSRR